MKSLVFGVSAREDGKRILNARFEERSSLPTSAACVVASGVRETLSALLRTPVTLRLFEPTIPLPHAWLAIVQGAQLYRVWASKADAAIVLRPPDAAALAAAAFGEPQLASYTNRALSPIEREVLDRAVRALAGSLAAVCGMRDGDGIETVGQIDDFVTYFELQVETPVTARIGIALSSDPRPEPRGRLTVEDLFPVELVPVALLDLGTIETRAIARLLSGAFLPVVSPALRRVNLQLNGRTLVHGLCGVRNGRYAITVQGSV